MSEKQTQAPAPLLSPPRWQDSWVPGRCKVQGRAVWHSALHAPGIRVQPEMAPAGIPCLWKGQQPSAGVPGSVPGAVDAHAAWRSRFTPPHRECLHQRVGASASAPSPRWTGARHRRSRILLQPRAGSAAAAPGHSSPAAELAAARRCPTAGMPRHLVNVIFFGWPRKIRQLGSLTNRQTANALQASHATQDPNP